MNRTWGFSDHAVTVEGIDFVDPAIRERPDARERGVRLELRPSREEWSGSVYASPGRLLGPGLLRVDLLESAPGAADRMHWHPRMRDGEPGGRTFDDAMPADPRAWLVDFLVRLAEHAPPGVALGADAAAIAAAADEIADAAVRALGATRGRWPPVEHDERGLAPA